MQAIVNTPTPIAILCHLHEFLESLDWFSDALEGVTKKNQSVSSCGQSQGGGCFDWFTIWSIFGVQTFD